jgi:mannose-6-phosphate isomerase-like protein (cupin superfamily)
MSEGRTGMEAQTRRIDKPWGHELLWALTERYCGKLLFVKAGESLSLQFHREKDESWYVLDGRATLEVGRVNEPTDTIQIGDGDAFHFPPGTVHRVTALTDIRILEVSTPEVEDVVRLEDRYGRAEGES